MKRILPLLFGMFTAWAAMILLGWLRAYLEPVRCDCGREDIAEIMSDRSIDA